MTWLLIKRAIIFREIAAYRFQPKKHVISSTILQAVHSVAESARDSPSEPASSCYNRRAVHSVAESARDSLSEPASSSYNRTLQRPPLISTTSDQPIDYKIDIVDDETWQVLTGFATNPSHDRVVNDGPRNADEPDLDEVDDMRIRGNLFYKLDRDSKEYEEYNYDFHRKKSKSSKTKTKEENDPKKEEKIKESKTKGNPNEKLKLEKMKILEKKSLIGKKERVPTFNQVTGPYHEPFCLDLYISKSSVRACIVHRATSKVVAVAHSISKDMKFDLGSTKNAAACAAVGKVLAQRALADDIHNVVYTPRKGEKLEGKLQCVLQAVIDNGVCVKIKIKKKNAPKSGFQFVKYKHN